MEISRGARFNSLSVDLVKARGRLGEAVAGFPFPVVRGGQLSQGRRGPCENRSEQIALGPTNMGK